MKRTKKTVETTNDCVKSAIEILESTKNQFGNSKVWECFLSMGICCYARSPQEPEGRMEQEYFKNVEILGKEIVRNEIPKLLSLAILASEIDFGFDFLGSVHEQRGNSVVDNGEFFTPRGITSMCSLLVTKEEEVKNKTIYDPTCGSGRSFIVFANDKGRYNFFHGWDSNHICAKMSVMNLAIRGLSGRIVQGNTTSLDVQNVWNVNYNGKNENAMLQQHRLDGVRHWRGQEINNINTLF